MAVAGTEYTWTVEVDNLGPDTAVGAFTITDTLPVATTFVSAVGAGWNCSETAGTVTCTRADVADTLPRGRSFDPVSITVAVPSDFQDALQNTATVVARTLDPDTQNNTDDAQVRSTGEADLQLVKNRTNPTIVAGQTTTYMLDVTNLGPSTSRADITVIDTLPSSASFVSASASPGPWNCTHDGAVTGGDVSCVLSEDVAAGAAAPP